MPLQGRSGFIGVSVDKADLERFGTGNASQITTRFTN